MAALEQEAERLHQNKVRLKIIGDIAPFGARVVELAHRAQELTSRNTGLTLTIAANYGGRLGSVAGFAEARAQRPAADRGIQPRSNSLRISHSNYAPEPDLFIRTGASSASAISWLWQLAYTELYFTPTLWPDFDARQLDAAIACISSASAASGRPASSSKKPSAKAAAGGGSRRAPCRAGEKRGHSCSKPA